MSSAAIPASPTFRCPVPSCDAPDTVAAIGGVSVESGDYSLERDAYDAEGDADVYACNNDHRFAYDPPFAEDDEDEDGVLLVHYRHADCPEKPGVEWCSENGPEYGACNDECPECGTSDIEPVGWHDVNETCGRCEKASW